MSMTKKDYVLIAGVLAEYLHQVTENGEQDATTVCRLMADSLAQENPLFDRKKFYNACYGVGNES